MKHSKTATTGIRELDTILRSLWIGDNVVWEVEAGTYIDLFIDHFIRASLNEGHPVVYISFNRSPATMTKRIGASAQHQRFTFIDCFTLGKGRKDPTFTKFYKARSGVPTNVKLFEKPTDPDALLDAVNRIQEENGPRTRYVFDSLTGMQDLWGDENRVYKLFTYACPRLYDLDTVAYWILEKDAHTAPFRANLKHVTQVALELSASGERLFLKANKVEGRYARNLYKPRTFEAVDGKIRFLEAEYPQKLDIGTKIKDLRTQRGLTQRELADKIGVTASFISQVERNQISPSISSLIDVATELHVDPAAFFTDARSEKDTGALVAKDARKPYFSPTIRRTGATVQALTNEVPGRRMEAFFVELPAGAEGGAPVFMHKGEELVYVLQGKVEILLHNHSIEASEGDTVYLEVSAPSGWRNIGKTEAQLLWVLSPARMT